MRNQRTQTVTEFMYLALHCVLAALVYGLLTALTLTGIVLFLSSYTLGID